MTHRVNVDFDKARVNIVDGYQAASRGNYDDASHFSEEAKKAMDDVPEDLPYIEEYRNSLDDHDFAWAFESIVNLAAYVRDYEEDDYTFRYQSSALERLEDEYRELEI